MASNSSPPSAHSLASHSNNFNSPLSSLSSSSILSPTDEYLRHLFCNVDADESGYLCKVELRQLCSKFGIADEEADGIFTDLDADGDGKITFEEFRNGFDDYEKGILTGGATSSPLAGYENIKKGVDLELYGNNNNDYARSKRESKSRSRSKIKMNNKEMNGNGHERIIMDESYEDNGILNHGKSLG